jgi:replicative superfamily II helicase
MAIIATFIGIDKHADPRIRDLMGARRDAMALWALFADTMPNIQARLLTNDEATVAGVLQVLDETFYSAGPDDTIILSFSGHGTRDHRLVTHDTTIENLSTTTIPMSDLAGRFKRTPAKTVLCILDCCFSGGATARVLEDSPIVRDPADPLQELVGKGRILIAASNVDEPAYEHPYARHGLLTKALMDALQGDSGVLSLTTVMGNVLDLIRGEAARLGVVQTPVLLGQVEGGLTLPALRRGQHFYAHFPEHRGVKVTSDIASLAAFNIPSPVLDEWAKQFTGGLNDLQLRAVNDHRILEGESLLVVAPTSSGKTFIGEMASARAIVEGRKAVFLLPYRALVNEKYDRFSALYGDKLGMRVIRCSGDYQDQVQLLVKGKYDLALLTYEMWLNLVVSTPAILAQIGLVVLDEAQFITDPMRGVTVELLLTYMLTARERGIAPQLIALSAVIGDINDFDGWLSCEKLVTDYRPVKLVEGVLDRNGLFQYRDDAGTKQVKQLLDSYSIRQRREKPGAQDVIVPLVKQLMGQGEKVIVFRNQRGKAQGCAKYLAADLGLSPANDIISLLPNHDLPQTSEVLRTCLRGGTAFHSTDLMREERAIVEQAFRDPDSNVRVLGATTTVAAGINTPASTVILAEQEFRGDDGRPFTVAEYKNMAGRAGRLGFNNNEGKAIILADNSYQREELFQRYVQGQLEPLRSSFSPDKFDTWIIRLLAQVERIERTNVVRLLSNTFGGYVANKQHPGWRHTMEERLEHLMQRMLSLDLLEQEREYVQLTLLGRACGRSALSFESALRLVELLRQVLPSDLTAERLVAILQVLPESDNGYTPMMRKGRSEAIRPQQVATQYGPTIVRLLQKYVRDELEYWARCKRAAILSDWVNGIPIETIESRYTPNPYQGRIGHGDVRKFADATRFHLRAAHQIASVMLLGQGPDETSIEAMLRQLEVGVPADVLGLLALPVQLGRGEYLALRSAGVTTVEAVWALSAAQIQQLLGPTRTAQLEAFRE